MKSSTSQAARIQRPTAKEAFFTIKVRQHPETKVWEVFTHKHGIQHSSWRWYMIDEKVAEWYMLRGAQEVEYVQDERSPLMAQQITEALKRKATDSEQLRTLQIELQIAVDNYMRCTPEKAQQKEQQVREALKAVELEKFKETYRDFDDSEIQSLF